MLTQSGMRVGGEGLNPRLSVAKSQSSDRYLGGDRRSQARQPHSENGLICFPTCTGRRVPSSCNSKNFFIPLLGEELLYSLQPNLNAFVDWHGLRNVRPDDARLAFSCGIHKVSVLRQKQELFRFSRPKISRSCIPRWVSKIRCTEKPSC